MEGSRMGEGDSDKKKEKQWLEWKSVSFKAPV